MGAFLEKYPWSPPKLDRGTIQQLGISWDVYILNMNRTALSDETLKGSDLATPKNNIKIACVTLGQSELGDGLVLFAQSLLGVVCASVDLVSRR